jgi:DNA polymerase (family 10)
VRALREIAVLLELRGESAYRIRAYETAASRIAQVEGDLGAMVREGRLEALPGIGPKLAARVAELVTTGRSSYLEELKGGFPPGISELVRVPGLGAKRAVALWEAIGVGDLKSLRRAVADGSVQHVPGFGPRAEAKLKDALAQLESQPPGTEQKRLLGETLIALEELALALTSAGAARAEVAGDVRRACEEVSDAVIVAAAKEPAAVLDAVGERATVAKVASRQDDRVRARLFHPDLVVEVRAVKPGAFGAMLLDGTGSASHVAHLRALAESRGLSLTAHGLHRGGKRVAGEDEAGLYAALGLPFIPPELRDREVAEAGAPFDDLLDERDVKGLVHSHSTWSDGKATLEEMAQAAKARGYLWMTVTDHSQTASYAGGLKEADLQRQWEEIARLNEQLRPFRLLRGVESDILREGGLDYPDSVLRQFDVVVGSIHNRYGLDERQTTDRVLRALAHPSLSILGHPTGRLLQRRPPVALRMDEVLAAAAEHGVAVELNGSPHRLDLSAAHAELAVRRDVKLVVSADSHSVREIGNVRYAVLTARRAGVRRGAVLNTGDAEQFLASLARARR